MGFRELAFSHPGKWPLLERSLADYEPAMNPKVEWTSDEGIVGGDRVLFTQYNYCQIFRGKTAEEVADMVESALRDGQRTIGSNNLRTMGGALFFLGREPKPEDSFRLRLLRDLTHRKIGDEWLDWLAEVSLEAQATAHSLV